MLLIIKNASIFIAYFDRNLLFSNFANNIAGIYDIGKKILDRTVIVENLIFVKE